MLDHHRIVVLGAGIGGLGMAARLKMAGHNDFIILEKADRVGGTWRDNVYPGAACDVQSHLYWYSFDEQPDWTRLYPGQPEIHRNIERMVARHELRPHIRFNAEVVDAAWDEGAAHWVIRTAAGRTMTADIFIAAQGQLNRPTYRGIKGIDSFHGPWFHSARWNHDVQLGGKRVASVGNGCSAVQFIPELVKDVAHLTVFQRSANYIVPRLDRQYTDEERAMYLRDIEKRAASRTSFYDEHETWIGAMRQGTEKAAEFTAVARAHLEAQIGNPELRAKLWPDYPIGCKRIIISDDYYPALTRLNVALITDPIEQVEAKGIRTRDGTLHELDAIVYATGFETLSFLGTLSIEGRGGLLLSEVWQDGPEAYLGMAVAGFPNLFLLYGPNTNLGHNSIIAMLECQFDYVLQAVAALDGARALELKADVMRSYNEQVQQSLKGSSWDGGCNSWYKNKNGKITNNWTGTVEDYKARTARLELGEYQVA
jgi:cation diffusion facilitator CzcD-associated flavoprotein CzcO